MSDFSSHILFADEDIVVLNKPAGVVVNQADSNRSASIQEWMREYVMSQPVVAEEIWQQQVPTDFDAQYGSPIQIWQERHGLVHRLDKDTSGVMVFAKHPGALVNLLQQFRLRKVHKTYLCLVHGGLPLAEGVINAPLKRALGDRKKFAVTIDGRPAVTAYKVLERYQTLRCLEQQSAQGFRPANEPKEGSTLSISPASLKMLRQHKPTYTQGFSLLACEPKTGRTHQIRVHLAHVQHPLVGDQVYVGKKRAKLDSLWCPRQFLHAQQLIFTHPRTNQPVTITCALPPDLDSVLQQLA